MSDESTDWRKSTRCDGGACIEVASWRKSTRSTADGQCVEVGTGPAVVGVRDTVLAGASPVLEFSDKAWKQFTEGLQAP